MHAPGIMAQTIAMTLIRAMALCRQPYNRGNTLAFGLGRLMNVHM